jgi:hypothetical protein
MAASLLLFDLLELSVLLKYQLREVPGARPHLLILLETNDLM